jgi:hypothetical protein
VLIHRIFVCNFVTLIGLRPLHSNPLQNATISKLKAISAQRYKKGSATDNAQLSKQAEATSFEYTRLGVSQDIRAVPQQLVNEKSEVNCVLCIDRPIWSCLIFLRYEQHLFFQCFVSNLPPISHWQVVAKQYVLRNTKSGVLRCRLRIKMCGAQNENCSFTLGWSRKWIFFLFTRKSTFFRKYFYLHVITRKYS